MLTFTEIQDAPRQRVRLARINGAWWASFTGEFGDDFTMALPYSKNVEASVIVAYLQRLNPDCVVVAEAAVLA